MQPLRLPAQMEREKLTTVNKHQTMLVAARQSCIPGPKQRISSSVRLFKAATDVVATPARAQLNPLWTTS